MSVTKIEELEKDRTSGWNRLWQRVYTRVYRVICSSRDDGPVVIRANTTVTPLIPSIGNSYFVKATELDLGAFVDDVQYQFVEFDGPTGCVWEVKVNYSPYDASIFPVNPLDWPPIYWYETEDRDIVVTQDINGIPIVNSAGESFADPVTVTDRQRILVVERREAMASYDDHFADGFRNRRNDAAWNGWSTHEVLCQKIIAPKPEYDSNAQVWYRVIQYRFGIDTKYLWNKVILDVGYGFLDGSTPPKVVRIMDKTGQPLSEPSKLDGSGHVLASTGTPNFITFEVIEEADFSAFNIDLSHCLGR
jgi:hypothetical protein